MKIQGNYVPSSDQAHTVSSPKTSVSQFQKMATPRHGDVPTLASEGRQSPLPQGFTQQDTYIKKHTAAKHNTQPLTALKEKDLTAFRQKTAKKSSPPADTIRLNRGKQSLFSTPHTSIESGETSASSPGQRAGKAPMYSPPHRLVEHGESSAPQKHHPDTLSKTKHTSASSPSPSPSPSPMPSRTSSAASATAADTPHQAAIEVPQLGIKAGQLTIKEQTSPHLATLLQETLGKPSQSYVSHESQQAGQAQLLLDKKGKVFQISTHPETGMIALHTSVAVSHSNAVNRSNPVNVSNPVNRSNPINSPARMTGQHNPLTSIRDHLSQSGNPAHDNNILSLATGVHTDNQGQNWRIHDDKLHHLEAWGHWKEADQNLSKLTAQGDQGLYGLKDKQQIVNVATQQAGTPMGKEISDYSINQSGTVAVLLKSEDHAPSTLRFLPSMAAKGDQALEVTAHYISDQLPERRGEPPHLTAIELTNDTLFAIDNENRVLTAPLPHGEQTDIGFTEIKQDALQTTLGKDIQFEGFSHQRDGNLSLLVKDNQDQLHTCPLSRPSLRNHINNTPPTFKPGWNLSDSLHIDNRLGLHQIDHHAIQPKNFDHQGTLGFLDHKIYAKAMHTDQWHEIEKDVDSLQRGHDGQAYALKEGELKKVTLDHKTGKISYGENNVFAITTAQGKIKLEDGPKGAPDKNQIAVATVINAYQHVTLSTSGDLTFTNLRPGTEKTIHPEVTIPKNGLEGEIKQLGVDGEQTLYALTDQGKLFSLAAKDWQKPQVNDADTKWKAETAPTLPADLKGAHLDLTQDRKLTLTTVNDGVFTQEGHQWEATSPPKEPRSTAVRDRLFTELADHAQMKKGPKGVRYTTETQLGGMTTQPGTKISSKFSDRMRAHIFKPGFDVPRPAKTAAHAVQHHWQGREGLNTLYSQEKALFKQLEATNTHIKSNLSPRTPIDIKTRLDKLNLGEHGTPLKKELESLRHHLEYSAERQLVKLGKHQGVLSSAGELNLNYKPSKLKDAKQAFNPNRSGHSLSEALLTSWKHTPPSNDSNAGQLLKAYKELNVNMSYQKTQVPMGRRRDPNDQMALVKSRLVLDTLTLQKLDKLIEKAELVATDDPQKAPTKAQLTSLQKDLSELKNDIYEQNPVKHYSDRGMESHTHVESSYDASKFFIKAFSKPDHGVNLITRSALHAEDQEALNDKMKALLHGLKPSDSVSIGRNYGATASSAFLPSALQNTLFAVFPNGSANQNSEYSINFSGQENGIQVTIGKDSGQSAGAGIGVARNVLTDIAGKPQGHFNKKINGGEQTFKPSVVAVASLSATLGSTEHNDLSFSIKGDDIDQFIDGLTRGNISPDKLVDKGMEHAANHGHKFNFSVDVNATLQGRAGFDVFKHNNTRPAANPNDKATVTESYAVSSRIGGGITLKANLATIANEKMSGREIESSKQSATNKNGLLTSTSAGAEIGARVGATRVNATGIMPAGVDLKASVTATIDNAIKVKGELKSKQANPVTPKEIDKVLKDLKSAFHDPASQKLINDVKALPDPDSQLDKLTAHFDHLSATNDKQHVALNDIKKTATQQVAANNHTDVMSDATATITHNNPHNLDKPGMVSFLTSLISPTGRGTLEKQLHTMMEKDPVVSSMLAQMHEKPNTHVAVTLELKDDIRQQLEKDVAAGKATLAQTQKALENPENRRIKSLTITEKGTHKEGFSSPVLFVGGSSSASIGTEKDAGTIAFKYGAEQNTPRSYTLSGDITTAKPEVTAALRHLQNSGLEVRTELG